MTNVRTNRLLTYADYAAMAEDGKRYELLDGILFEMAAPSENHQVILIELVVQLNSVIDAKRLRLLCAPFDVRFPKPSESPDNATTVVQPDILVANRDGLNGICLTGAPIFVIEILSPSNPNHDRVTKLHLYETHGVQEYWIIDPTYRSVDIHRLEQGVFSSAEQIHFTQSQSVNALPGAKINLARLTEILQ